MRNTRSALRAHAERWKHEPPTQKGFRFFHSKVQNKGDFDLDWSFQKFRNDFKFEVLHKTKGSFILVSSAQKNLCTHMHGNIWSRVLNKSSLSACERLTVTPTWMSVGANSEQRRDQRASTAHQWTSGHDTIIIYHNQELSGQATSLWGCWCNAQAEMVPGDGVASLERHTKQNKDPSKTIPFSIWAVFFAALYEVTFSILHI